MPRDPKLSHIFRHTLQISYPPPFESVACREVLDVYLANLNRAHGLVDAAVFSAYTAATKEGYRALFYQREFGTFAPTEKQMQDNEVKFSSELGKRFTEVSPHQFNLRATRYADELDQYIQVSGEDVQAVFVELLKSMIVMNWSATEVMLGDLWESVLNEHPDCLAHLRDKDLPKSERDLDRQISLDSISGCKFDIRNSMGTILREKFNFQVLVSAQKAYACAFWKDGDLVKEAVYKDGFKALAILRNVIVHNAGKIDQRFFNDSGNLSSLRSIRAPGVGNHIALDGEMLQNVAKDATDQALLLFHEVGAWLKNHPSEKLAAAGMLWVVGGNTFLLRKAMHLSGLDQLIHGKVDDGHFLYGGYSAGICVLSPSLRGIHLADEPEARSNGYEHPTIWEGLGVIDYYIVPHYRCDHFESESMEAVVDYYRENDLPYRAIPDGEVILDTTHNREQVVAPDA